MDQNTKIKKLELEREIAKAEKERDRSLKWFIVNLLILVLALAFAGLILWGVPQLVGYFAKKFKMLDVQGNIPENANWVQKTRLDYIKQGVFFFVFGWVATWVFWALFRFRKWTNYQHQVDTLRKDLKKLEEEN